MPQRNGNGPASNRPRTGRGIGRQNISNITNERNLGKRKLDGTGPEGKGQKTGRGFGNCK